MTNPIIFSAADEAVQHELVGASLSGLWIMISYILGAIASVALIVLIILFFKKLLKHLKSQNNLQHLKEKANMAKSLGEILRERRIRCHMTQEFVAEALGVSRQAVSKWENGNFDPSTSNLLALAKLYGVSAADLLKDAG